MGHLLKLGYFTMLFEVSVSIMPGQDMVIGLATHKMETRAKISMRFEKNSTP
jgi:hypothetical protein